MSETMLPLKEVKKKRGRKRKLLLFHKPSTGPYQFQSPSQPKEMNGNKGKKGLHTGWKKRNKKNQK